MKYESLEKSWKSVVHVRSTGRKLGSSKLGYFDRSCLVWTTLQVKTVEPKID